MLPPYRINPPCKRIQTFTAEWSTPLAMSCPSGMRMWIYTNVGCLFCSKFVKGPQSLCLTLCDSHSHSHWLVGPLINPLAAFKYVCIQTYGSTTVCLPVFPLCVTFAWILSFSFYPMWEVVGLNPDWVIGILGPSLTTFTCMSITESLSPSPLQFFHFM